MLSQEQRKTNAKCSGNCINNFKTITLLNKVKDFGKDPVQMITSSATYTSATKKRFVL